MKKGFNSDISIRGKQYHIQTEDWGRANPFVVTRIFCNGAVLKTIKTPYALIFQKVATVTGIKQTEDQVILVAMQTQHEHILDSTLDWVE